MNVWLVYLSYGRYEDYNSSVIGVFDSEVKAKTEVDRVENHVLEMAKRGVDQRVKYLIELNDPSLKIFLAEEIKTINCWFNPEPIEVK